MARSHPLYPLALDAHYRILWRGFEIVGEGRTAWVGSKEVVFIASGPLPPCDRIEISLFWPVELEGGARLKLVIQGRIYNRDRNQISVGVTKYEFHTRAASSDTRAEPKRLSSFAPAVRNSALSKR